MKKLGEKLENYIEADYYPFHMPGHKRNEAMCKDIFPAYLSEWYQRDITEIDGFDNMHQPEEILKDAMEDAARLYGAKETLYLINGSSSGVLIALSAVAPKGSKILMMRSSHRSAYHGVFLRELKPVYLCSKTDPILGLDLGVTPVQVREAVEKDEDISAVFLTSPTYEGISLNIREIAEFLRDRKIPLIVDAAHGAHFGMADFLPKNAVLSGADLVIHSLHKTLPSPTMSALLHYNSKLVSRENLHRFYNIYQTSSPSYPMMAGMEACIDYLEKMGAEGWKAFFLLRKELSESLTGLKNLGILDMFTNSLEEEPFGGKKTGTEISNLQMPRPEIGKMVIYLKNSAVSGPNLAKLLLEDYHLQVEMAMPGYVLLIMTLFDTKEGYCRLAKALIAIDDREELWENGKRISRIDCPLPVAPWERKKRMEISEAMELPNEWILLKNAIGRTGSNFVSVYPPGQPYLVPGEEIGEVEILQLNQYIKSGCSVNGLKIEKESSEDNKIWINVLK